MITLGRVKIIVACLALILATFLLRFKISLHGDSLFLELLATDLFSLGGKWRDWRLAPAPAYFPDMILYFLSYGILPNAFERIFFVSASQVALLVLAVTWTSKQIYPKISHSALATQILLLAFMTLVASKSGMWLYFYTVNNHFASLLCPLLCLGLGLRFYEKPSWFDAILFIVIGVIAKTSTAVCFINFLVPGIASCLGVLAFSDYFYKKFNIHRKKIVWILGILTVTHLVSLIIDGILTFNDPLDGRTGLSPKSLKRSFGIFLQATTNAFSLDNGWTFLLGVLISTSLLFLIYKFSNIMRGNSQTPADGGYEKLTIAFLLIVIPINVLGAILSGGVIDIFCYRYILFPIALSLILMVIFIDRSRWFSSKPWNWVYFLTCSASIIFSLQILKKKDPVSVSISPVATCLTEVEREGFNLGSGIASY